MSGYYFYSEDEYCFYIHHTDVDLKIPIGKNYCDKGIHHIISCNAMEKIVDDLNKKESQLIFDFYDELIKRGFIKNEI